MTKYIFVSILKDDYIESEFNTNLDYIESEINDIVDFCFHLNGVDDEDEKEGMKVYIDVKDEGNMLYFDTEEVFVKIKKVTL